jgi:hypothetical protein
MSVRWGKLSFGGWNVSVLKTASISFALFVTLQTGMSTTDCLAADKFEPLLKRLPASTNAIMVVDVAALHKSPLAVKENWKDLHEGLYVNSPIILPPESDRVVVASQMNPNQNFEQLWELAVMSLTEKMSMLSIARAEGGYVDHIGELDAAWVPNNAYFVMLNQSLLGVMHPAQRQLVSQWARQDDAQIRISNYLQQSSKLVDDKTQIILAMDLSDCVQPHVLHEKLLQIPQTQKDPAKLKAWEQVISSIQGISLQVQVSADMEGILQIDFKDEIAPLKADGKELLLKVLDNHGVLLEDFNTWQYNAQSYSMTLSGKLTKSGMRQVFSILELPTAKFSTMKDDESKISTDPAVIGKCTLAYYKSLMTLLNDMEKEYKSSRDARKNCAATFMARYADRIDKLPILNIDEEMLNYGASVANSFRDSSVVASQAGINQGVRNSQLPAITSGSYGNYNNGYGYGAGTGIDTSGAEANAAAGNAIRTQERAVATMQRYNSWNEIEKQKNVIRRQMTQKYSLPF